MIFGVTGHRHVEQEPGELLGFARLSVARMAEAGTTEIITGMALGWDLAVARACIDLGVPFRAAVPFPMQASTWSPEDRAEWQACMDRAASIWCGAQLPLNQSYHQRNHYIVDECRELWSLYDGVQRGFQMTRGGTKHCVLYAASQGRKIVPLWSDWLRFRQGD